MDDIEFLKQPLLTEDGFLNEACVNEIQSVLNSIPPTYERLRDDEEWSNPRCVFKHDIVGAFAKWAIRQSPMGIPTGLESVCGYLDACLTRDVVWEYGIAELSLCDINKLLHDILMNQNIKSFDDWNRSQAEKDGVDSCDIDDDPFRPHQPHPYHDFIDLDALLHNVCLDIRDERRVNDEFDITELS